VSRIGRMPIELPEGVEATIAGTHVKVKGPKGELERTFRVELSIQLADGVITVERSTDAPKVRALHGLTRALINNMVHGVSQGFEKVLQVEGVGYRPSLEGTDLVLNVGYSHPVTMPAPPGIQFEVDERPRLIKVQGCDKELVGQVAAEIREVRPPEPYKGKGIRYFGEKIRRKAGKAGKVE
jgi:large subunit ribosomal protein L6